MCNQQKNAMYFYALYCFNIKTIVCTAKGINYDVNFFCVLSLLAVLEFFFSFFFPLLASGSEREALGVTLNNISNFS